MLSQKIKSFFMTTAFVSFSLLTHPIHGMDELDEHVRQAIPDTIKPYVHSYLISLPKLNVEALDSVDEKSQKLVQFFIELSPKRHNNSNLFEGQDILSNRLQTYLQSEDPIAMITIGFPSKSTNTETKVLSEVLDMGEFFGLLTYDYLCREIKKIHKPGAFLTIYSDGLPYNTLLGISKDVFDHYQSSLKALVALFGESLCLWRFSNNRRFI